MITTIEANERLAIPTEGPASDRQSWKAKPSLPPAFDPVLNKIKTLVEGGLTFEAAATSCLELHRAPRL